MKKISFLCGLPRSGSTILSKILNQHPQLFCTGTSPVLDYISNAAHTLSNLRDNHASGHMINVEKILQMNIKEMFSDIQKDHIIDKNREWILNIPAVQSDLKFDPRVIVTLRPIHETIISFDHILKKNNKSHSGEEIYTIYIKPVYEMLMSTNYEGLHPIFYNDLLERPEEELSKLVEYLGEDVYNFSFDNIDNTNQEKDEKWGLTDLHKTRKVLKKDQKKNECLSKVELDYCDDLTRNLFRKFGREYEK